MSWMHDRALAPRSRRRSPQQTAATRSFGGPKGAAPEGPTDRPPNRPIDGETLFDADHVGIPYIITRRARWVTSRLRQR
jgi:hypothetical protein